MATLLGLHLAGALATLVTSLLIERRWPAHQRNGLVAQAGLALVWPLYLLFLAAVAIAGAVDEGG